MALSKKTKTSLSLSTLLAAAALASGSSGCGKSSGETGCNFDKDCPPEQICLSDGTCGEQGECYGDKDCPTEQFCDDGICLNQESSTAAKILSGKDFSQLEDVSSDKKTWSFDSDSSYAKSLKKGDVIVADINKHTPYGALRKVSSKSNSGSQIFVTTTQATLEDAISNGTLEGKFELSPEYLNRASPLREGVSISTQEGALKLDLIDINFDHTDLYKGMVYLDGHLQAGLEMILEVGVKKFKVQHVLYKISGSEELRLELSGGFSTEFQKELTKFEPIAFPPITFMIPTAVPIPVVITPHLYLTFGVEAKGELSIETSVEQSINVAYGMQYERPNWNDIKTFEPTLDFNPPNWTEINGSIEVYAKPEFSLEVYDVSGPYVEANAYVGAEGNFTNNPSCKLYTGMEVEGGVKVEVFGKTFADYHTNLLDWENVLFKCGEDCKSGCNQNGQKVCDGNGWKECGDYDGNGCTEWSEINDCLSTEYCGEGACHASELPDIISYPDTYVSPDTTCTNECDSVGQICISKYGYTDCHDFDGDGCLDYKYVSCGSGEKCVSVGNGAICVPDCEDECLGEEENEVCTPWNEYVTCKDTDGDGCLEMAFLACPAGTTCTPGEGCVASCTSECTAAEDKTCSGSNYIECYNKDADSCLEKTVKACAAGTTCTTGKGCVANCEDECMPSDDKTCPTWTSYYLECKTNFDADSCLDTQFTACTAGTTCTTGEGCVSACTPNEKVILSYCFWDGTEKEYKKCKSDGSKWVTYTPGCWHNECSGNTCTSTSGDALSSCTVNSDCISCTSECTAAEDKTCSGSNYIECYNKDADSCLEKTVKACAAGTTCTAGKGCVANCTEECKVTDDKTCQLFNNSYIECYNKDADSCLEQTVTYCASGTTCTLGKGCVANCIEECKVTEDKTCSGSNYIECYNKDADSCLEKTVKACAAGTTCTTGKGCVAPTCTSSNCKETEYACEDGMCKSYYHCVDNACVCGDKCSAGATFCETKNVASDTAGTCADFNNDGCIDAKRVDCVKTYGTTCKDGKCTGAQSCTPDEHVTLSTCWNGAEKDYKDCKSDGSGWATGSKLCWHSDCDAAGLCIPTTIGGDIADTCLSDADCATSCNLSNGCTDVGCVFYDEFVGISLDTLCKWDTIGSPTVSGGNLHITKDYQVGTKLGIFDSICNNSNFTLEYRAKLTNSASFYSIPISGLLGPVIMSASQLGVNLYCTDGNGGNYVGPADITQFHTVTLTQQNSTLILTIVDSAGKSNSITVNNCNATDFLSLGMHAFNATADSELVVDYVKVKCPK